MDFIKGMDISTIIEEEYCGARFFDEGKEGDALEILKKYGTNYVRLRLWNDPYDEDGNPYGAGTNDLEKTILLAKRAKALGMGVLLDLHYSDFWADPGKQILPKAWRDMDRFELVSAVHDFTVDVMKTLHAADAAPTMVQVGNEITNGLLWPSGQKPNFDEIARYISAGIAAVKEVDKDVPIMIHLDNGGNNPMYVEWFDNYVARGEDFDIIGLSYYPFWHGSLEDLSYNMKDMARRYGKKICVAEVSMGFTMEDYRIYEVPDSVIIDALAKSGQLASLKEDADVNTSLIAIMAELSTDDIKRYRQRYKTGDNEPLDAWMKENLMPYATKPELVEKLPYTMTPEGQADFMQDVMQRIADVPGGLGFFYWEPAWVPVPGCGWATYEALAYTGEKGCPGNEWANQALFDYQGNVLPALKTIRDF